MPRTLSSALILSKNTINSINSWAFLVNIKYRTALPPSETFANLYFTNYDRVIIFNSQTFIPYPVSVGELSENSTGETTRFQLGIGNIGNAITDILNLYWLNIADPLWFVNVWLVDTSQPVETSVASNESYTVVSVTTTLLAANLDCIWVGVGYEKRLPGRRYTKLSGYEHIPRIIR